ncbi:MAG: hypothetical protein K2H46_00440 [Muribaculaceae bacterium]|nr:hypothetical protein [Muribaculaceae bacterium]
MATPSFRNELRGLIRRSLSPEQELKLSGLVRVPNNSMIGYGDICALYRHGKRGIASVVDQFNNLYYLSELSEDACRQILALVP